MFVQQGHGFGAFWWKRSAAKRINSGEKGGECLCLGETNAASKREEDDYEIIRGRELQLAHGTRAGCGVSHSTRRRPHEDMN